MWITVPNSWLRVEDSLPPSLPEPTCGPCKAVQGTQARPENVRWVYPRPTLLRKNSFLPEDGFSGPPVSCPTSALPPWGTTWYRTHLFSCPLLCTPPRKCLLRSCSGTGTPPRSDNPGRKHAVRTQQPGPRSNRAAPGGGPAAALLPGFFSEHALLGQEMKPTWYKTWSRACPPEPGPPARHDGSARGTTPPEPRHLPRWHG